MDYLKLRNSILQKYSSFENYNQRIEAYQKELNNISHSIGECLNSYS